MEEVIKISVENYRNALTKLGLTHIRTIDGHEIWTRKDLARSITFTTLINEVPEMQILSNCRAMGIGMEELLDIIEKDQ